MITSRVHYLRAAAYRNIRSNNKNSWSLFTINIDGAYPCRCPYTYTSITCNKISANLFSLKFCDDYTTQQRYYGSQVDKDKVKPPLKAYRYVLKKLVSFITDSRDRLEDKLEKRIPNVFQVYKTFSSGVRAFVADTKDYYQVEQCLWRGESLKQLSRKQLELYSNFSGDLPLVGLMLVIAFAPGGLFVFPIAYVFPRFFLSHHFWTPDQKIEFGRIKIKKKVQHYDNVLHCMKLMSQHITSTRREKDIRLLIHKLENCQPLTSDEILDTLPLFVGKPYRMESLSIRHLRHVSRASGMSLQKRKLIKSALLLHYTDLAMKQEGIDSLDNEDLNLACSRRGLNPEGVERLEKITYLQTWVQISSQIEESNISLLLHLPVLLGYSQPTNQVLMGPLISRYKL